MLQYISLNAANTTCQNIVDIVTYTTVQLSLQPLYNVYLERISKISLENLLFYSNEYWLTTSSFPGVASYVFSLLWSGVRAAGGAVYYLGDSLVSAGQSVWQTLFGAGGGQTVGRGDSGGRPESRPGASDDDESKEGRAYRRQVRYLNLIG